jgi:hypothetical protein
MIKSILVVLVLAFDLNTSFAMESESAEKKVDLGNTLLFRVVNGTELDVDIYHFVFTSPIGVPIVSATVDHSTPVKIKAKDVLFSVYLKDCCLPFGSDVYAQFKNRIESRYRQIVRPAFVSLWPGLNCRHFSYAVPDNKVQLIKRDWVYFLFPGCAPHFKPFDIFVSQSFPDFNRMKYVLLEDNQSLFNILPRELKSLIIFSTLILEDLSA